MKAKHITKRLSSLEVDRLACESECDRPIGEEVQDSVEDAESDWGYDEADDDE